MPAQYKRYGFLDQHPEAILGPFAAAFGFLAYLNLAALATARPTVGGGGGWRPRCWGPRAGSRSWPRSSWCSSS